MKSEDSISILKDTIILRNNENLDKIISCLSLLDEAQIWHKPNTHTNSVANLILHLCGNVTQYIITSLTEKKDERNRASEFSTRNTLSKNELEKMITQCIINANKIIESTTETRIKSNQVVQGFNLSGIGNIVHACEHLSYHTGQIALLTKLMTNQDLGFYSDIDLDIT